MEVGGKFELMLAPLPSLRGGSRLREEGSMGLSCAVRKWNKDFVSFSGLTPQNPSRRD